MAKIRLALAGRHTECKRLRRTYDLDCRTYVRRPDCVGGTLCVSLIPVFIETFSLPELGMHSRNRVVITKLLVVSLVGIATLTIATDRRARVVLSILSRGGTTPTGSPLVVPRGQRAAPFGADAREVLGPPAVLKGSGRIRGSVVAASGLPLAHVSLRLYGDRFGDLATTTGRDGRFEYSELPQGRYVLSAAKPGYIRTYYGQWRPFEPIRVLEVGNDTSGDFNFSLRRGGVITGHVVDELGEPVANARVNAIRVAEAQDGDQAGRIRRSTIQDGLPLTPATDTVTVWTDDLGRFRLYGLAPAEYYVIVTPDEFAGAVPTRTQSREYLPTYFMSATDMGRAQRVRVSLQGEAVANVSIAPVRSVRVSGWVETANDRRSAEGSVRVAVRSGHGAITFVPGAASPVRSDGSFSVDVPAMGALALYASSGSPWIKPGVQRDIELGMSRISIGTTGASNVRIRRVKGATVAGVVVGTDQKVMAATEGLRVTAVAIDPEIAAAGILGSAPVQADGTFELHNVFGRSLIHLGGAIEAGWPKAVYVDGRDVTDVGLEFNSGERTGGIKVVLANPTTRISGTVKTATGQSVNNSIVVLFASDEAKWRHPLGRYVRLKRSLDDGRYSFAGLPSGEYLVIAVDAIETDAAMDPAVLSRLRQAATRVEFADGEQKVINLIVREACFAPDQRGRDDACVQAGAPTVEP
jgi:hypothetical protein